MWSTKKWKYVYEILIGSVPFSRKHPLACWLSTMMVVFAGGFLASVFLGEPLLTPFRNTQAVLLATAVWYVLLYVFFFNYLLFTM